MMERIFTDHQLQLLRRVFAAGAACDEETQIFVAALLGVPIKTQDAAALALRGAVPGVKVLLEPDELRYIGWAALIGAEDDDTISDADWWWLGGLDD